MELWTGRLPAGEVGRVPAGCCRADNLPTRGREGVVELDRHLFQLGAIGGRTGLRDRAYGCRHRGIGGRLLSLSAGGYSTGLDTLQLQGWDRHWHSARLLRLSFEGRPSSLLLWRPDVDSRLCTRSRDVGLQTVSVMHALPPGLWFFFLCCHQYTEPLIPRLGKSPLLLLDL